MDACEEYARRWTTKEDDDIGNLSERIKSIVDVLTRRIRRHKYSVNTRHESIFSDPDVVGELSRLHENFFHSPFRQSIQQLYIFLKRHYVSILTVELRLNSLPGNPTNNLTNFSSSEVLDNHKSVLTSFGIEITKSAHNVVLRLILGCDVEQPIFNVDSTLLISTLGKQFNICERETSYCLIRSPYRS